LEFPENGILTFTRYSQNIEKFNDIYPKPELLMSVCPIFCNIFWTNLEKSKIFTLKVNAATLMAVEKIEPKNIIFGRS
jgi:hypothetical protein